MWQPSVSGIPGWTARAARGVLACAVLLLALAGAARAQGGPTIDIWYGPTQFFGQPGNPQEWVNILGNASDPDGLGSLSYSLNGGPSQDLHVGPDTRRLLEPGDFNVEIAWWQLLPGANDVALRAVDGLGNTTLQNMTVQWQAGLTWPLPWTVDFGAATTVTDAVQPVDGKWHLEPGGLRTSVLGYDRTVVVGDLSWDDYEVTVPITMHGIDPGGYVFPSVAPGIGFTARWRGHTTLVSGEQPHAYWLPAGGGPWFDFEDELLWIAGGDGMFITDKTGLKPSDGATWLWKLRVEGLPNGDTFYGYKVWPQGSPEPQTFLLAGTEGPQDIQSGCLILIAHHVDATFGNVQLVDLSGDTTAPTISAVSVLADEDSATVSWETDEPATSRVEYGLTAGYELGLTGDLDLNLYHDVVLGGLQPATTYHYRIVTQDGRGNQTLGSDATFTTDAGPPASSLISDDFSAPTLNGAVWSFVDPLSDSAYSMTGGQLALSPFSGTVHDLWTNSNELPRIVQACADGDFEVEVKFESALGGSFSSQGLLFEEAADELVRIELHTTGSGTRVFVATFDNFQPTAVVNDPVPTSVPNWIRVRREGASWRVYTSTNGANFDLRAQFSHSMVVSAIGIFGGNDVGVDHTALCDYFFNNYAPVVPEDGGLYSVDLSVQGQGSVVKTPDLASYPAGSTVQLLAVPDAGWAFDNWTGDLAGSPNPVSFQVNGPLTAGVNFDFIANLTPPVISNLDVQAGPTGALVSWLTDEPADSLVQVGLTTAYELGSVGDAALKTVHGLTLQGLAPGSLYHYRVTSADAAGNPETTPDGTFVTAPPGGDPAGIVSDDFTTTDLDPAVWTLVDPLGDAHLVMTGTQARLELPAGAPHDLWTDANDVPRMVQPALDVDFELEARWESTPDADYRSQGIYVEEDATHFLRLEVHYYSGAVRLFAASILGNDADIHVNQVVDPGAPPYNVPSWLRLTRVGSSWTLALSFDGIQWIVGPSFDVPLQVSQVGAYAGNGNGKSVSAVLDSFFSTASPLIPEDADPTALSIEVLGPGSVTRSPHKLSYDGGEGVQLTPVPEAGYQFLGWSGDAGGFADPLVLTLGPATSVVATFGGADVVPPVLSGFGLSLSPSSALIQWTTDEPADSLVEYGLSPAYGSSVSDGAFVTQHALQLTGLTPGTLYHWRAAGVDQAGNPGQSAGFTFQTPAVGSGLVSDDFSAAQLDPARWTFIDPLGDGQAALDGTRLLITAPGNGLVHDAWTDVNDLPRLVQNVADTDFDLEVCFESVLTQNFQSQGVLIEESPDSFLRIEIHESGGGNKAFVAAIDGGSADILAFPAIPGATPGFLRVTRSGSSWSVGYSWDGQAYTTFALFNRAMTVSSVGVYAGNGGQVDHTAIVDWFFALPDVIQPEDANLSQLVVNTLGQGSVTLTPSKSSYSTGESVQLDAVAAPGWGFVGWQGPLSGGPSVQHTVGSGEVVTAVFSADDSLPPVLSGFAAVPSPNSAWIHWTTSEPADSVVEYGLDASYGGLVADALLVNQHALQLTGLSPGTLYHYRVTSADAQGNPQSSGDLTFQTPTPSSGLVSDDFSTVSLDPALWSFVNPLGDATVAVTGTQLAIGAPANGQVHDIWTGVDTLPRVTQAVADVDFDLEVRFESAVTQNFQSQGVLVEGAGGDKLRIEIHEAGSGLKAFVALLEPGGATTLAFPSIGGGTPEYLRVSRAGSSWSVSYSHDQQNWTAVANFSHAMTVEQVGLFAGNSGSVAHLAVIDYAFELSAPIVPEDGVTSQLAVNVIGQGSVAISPDLPQFQQGQVVQLHAQPPPGWVHSAWFGPVVGSGDSVQVTVGEQTEVTALFLLEGGGIGPVIDSLDPSSIGHLVVGTAQTVTITGSGFTPSTVVSVHGSAVEGGATVISPTELTFAWPLVELQGAVEVAVSNENGSATATVIVVANQPPVLQLGDGDEPVAVTPQTGIDIAFSGEGGTTVFLLGSFLDLPSLAPGLVSLEIGNGFSNLYLVQASLVPPSGVFELHLPYSYGGAPVSFHWQAVAIDAGLSLPLRATNPQETVIWN